MRKVRNYAILLALGAAGGIVLADVGAIAVDIPADIILGYQNVVSKKVDEYFLRFAAASLIFGAAAAPRAAKRLRRAMLRGVPSEAQPS